MNKVDVKKLCRTCLFESEDLYKLDERPSKLVDVKIIDMLSFCTATTIELTDTLPCSVCIPCFKTIRIAYNFIKEYQFCQKKLKQLIKACEEKSEVISDTDNCSQSKEVKTSDKIISPDEDVDKLRNMENMEESAVVSFIKDEFENEINPHEKDMEDNLIYFVLPDNPSEENTNKKNKNPNSSSNINENCLSLDNPCPVCKETTTNLLEHLVEVHEDMTFYCNNCKKKGKYIAAQYVQHLKEKHLPFCIQCNKMFPSRMSLAYHKRREHRAYQEYNCDQCNKKFSSRFQMVKHRKEIHSVGPNYFCEECEKPFRTHSAYKQHVRYHHYKSNKEYRCGICDKIFRFPFSLSHHMTVHSVIDNYICSKCGKGFRTCSSYNYHKKTHDNNRRHMCSFCGLTFLQSVHLKYHIDQKHKNVTYLCEICQRTYTAPSTLAKHKRRFHSNA